MAHTGSGRRGVGSITVARDAHRRTAHSSLTTATRPFNALLHDRPRRWTKCAHGGGEAGACCPDFGRAIFRERVRAGLARARVKGKRLGRPDLEGAGRAWTQRSLVAIRRQPRRKYDHRKIRRSGWRSNRFSGAGSPIQWCQSSCPSERELASAASNGS